MTAKHTPGPWTFVKWANEDMREAIERAGLPMVPMLTNQGQRIVMGPGDPPAHIAFVTCQTDFKRGTGHQAECEIRDANAALIAAAPRMLEALKKEQEWRDREAAGELDEEWDYETMVGQYRRAAIAKAEGRQ